MRGFAGRGVGRTSTGNRRAGAPSYEARDTFDRCGDGFLKTNELSLRE
jgi:hypothetical protein